MFQDFPCPLPLQSNGSLRSENIPSQDWILHFSVYFWRREIRSWRRIQSRRGNGSQAQPGGVGRGPYHCGGTFARDMQLSKAGSFCRGQGHVTTFLLPLLCAYRESSEEKYSRTCDFIWPKSFQHLESNEEFIPHQIKSLLKQLLPRHVSQLGLQRAIYFLAVTCQHLTCSGQRRRNAQNVRLRQTCRKWRFNFFFK